MGNKNPTLLEQITNALSMVKAATKKLHEEELLIKTISDRIKFIVHEHDHIGRVERLIDRLNRIETFHTSQDIQSCIRILERANKAMKVVNKRMWKRLLRKITNG